ncbi:hypothetical protein [Ligilactobacillus murinus]|uniref:Uncharacterized protein n=1 Tax=Ligilactobacillus murinus TaxID=1622 RepID=A0AAE6WGK7_9LACO|nr:hypothetical protein [Ligilactobacillus murinus]NEF83697.1 hypothetical protein [Ligilactobacillus murinus]NEF85962.1 hypothetical protein [Ligilactobacillus murinus]NEF88272.1 hypothetical protein [Ligilactobacillus murinus]NEF90541.1 hypothetical protein [Ligilactobacillus murinus]NEF92802.1 hypothetical protein [Ligilactobacillus murinus]
MKGSVKSLLFVATVFCLLFLTDFSVHAASVTVPDSLTSGEVQLDDHDHVVFASSMALVEQNEPKSQTLTDKQALFARLSNANFTAVNMPNSRWVYYSDHHNYFNNYKWGHSNYFNSVVRHSATAWVGNDHEKVVKDANYWAFAVAKGHGTFKAFYNNLPY